MLLAVRFRRIDRDRDDPGIQAAKKRAHVVDAAINQKQRTFTRRTLVTQVRGYPCGPAIEFSVVVLRFTCGVDRDQGDRVGTIERQRTQSRGHSCLTGFPHALQVMHTQAHDRCSGRWSRSPDALEASARARSSKRSLCRTICVWSASISLATDTRPVECADHMAVASRAGR